MLPIRKRFLRQSKPKVISPIQHARNNSAFFKDPNNPQTHELVGDLLFGNEGFNLVTNMPQLSFPSALGWESPGDVVSQAQQDIFGSQPNEPRQRFVQQRRRK